MQAEPLTEDQIKRIVEDAMQLTIDRLRHENDAIRRRLFALEHRGRDE